MDSITPSHLDPSTIKRLLYGLDFVLGADKRIKYILVNKSILSSNLNEIAYFEDQSKLNELQEKTSGLPSSIDERNNTRMLNEIQQLIRIRSKLSGIEINRSEIPSIISRESFLKRSRIRIELIISALSLIISVLGLIIS